MNNDFDPAEQAIRETTMNAIQGLDQDPDEARRALAIQRGTGYPAVAAMPNLESIEKDYHASIAEELVRDSKWMRTYIDSHPLAPALANGNYDKLHDVGTAVDNYTKQTPSKSWLQLAKTSLMRGMEEQQAATVGGLVVPAGGVAEFNKNPTAAQKYLYEREKQLSKLAQDDYPLSNNELNSYTNYIAGMAGHAATMGAGALGVAGLGVAAGLTLPASLAAGGIAFGLMFAMSSGERAAKVAEAKGATREEIGSAYSWGFAQGAILSRMRSIVGQRAINTVLGKAEATGIAQLPRAARMAIEAGNFMGLNELTHATNWWIDNGMDFKDYRPDYKGDAVNGIIGVVIGAAGGNYVKAGKNIPPGISVTVDELKAKMAEVRAKDFDEAVKAAQADPTREADPQIYRNALWQRTKATIDISANAIRKIYGEERPYSEDGKVGWIPNLEQQLDQAPSLGGHVTVPVADWVAHSTPEMQEALRDDIRHDDQGMTVNEAKEWEKAHEVKESEEKVRLEPQTPVEAIRAQAGLPQWERIEKGMEARPAVPPLYKGGWVKVRGDPRLRSTIGSTTVKDALLHTAPDIGLLKGLKQRVMNAINQYAGNIEIHVVDADTYVDLRNATLPKERQIKVGDDAPGAFYDPHTNQIVMFQAYYAEHPRAARTIFHESVHAATTRMMMATPEAKDRVRSLMVSLEKQNPKLSEMYGYTDEDEFLAETFSNPRFQHELTKTIVPDELVEELGLKQRATWLDAVFKIIADLFKVPKEQMSGFEGALRVGFDIAMTKVDPIGQKWLARGQELFGAPHLTEIQQRAMEEDARYAIEAERRAIARTKTPAYKAKRAQVEKEQREQMHMRPDVQVGDLFYNQKIGESKTSKQARLNMESLTQEERDALPGDFVGKGVDPEDIKGLFGYESGKDLVNDLIKTEREKGAKTFDEYKEDIVEGSTERRMDQIYGDDARSVIRRAKDNALSPTQMKALHEASGFKFSYNQTVARIRAAFRDFNVKNIDSDKMLTAAGKSMVTPSGRREGFVTVVAAREAHKFEKEEDIFSDAVKRWGKTEQKEMDAAYVDWMHYVMNRVGLKTERTMDQIGQSISARPEQTLESFVRTERAMGREIQVPEHLMDPNYKMEDGTVGEWRSTRDFIKGMASDARRLDKVYKGAKEYIFTNIRDKMVDELAKMRTFWGKTARKLEELGKQKKGWLPMLRAARAASLTVESILNRIDRDDPFGLFNQFIIKPLSKGGTDYARWSKEAMTDFASAVGNIKGLTNVIDHDLFFHPTDGAKFKITENELNGIVLQMGNPSSRRKFIEGFNLDEDQLDAWLDKVTTKEHWDRAQRVGDALEKWFKRVEDRDYKWRNTRPERNPIVGFENQFGVYKGWHSPIKYSRYVPGRSLDSVGINTAGGITGPLFYKSTMSRSYLEPRKPYVAFEELGLHTVAERLNVMIHDLALAQPFEQAAKFFRDQKFMMSAKRYLGSATANEFENYLHDLVNRPFHDTAGERMLDDVIRYFGGNFALMATAWNPHVFLKHVSSLAINSLSEEPRVWGAAWADLFRHDLSAIGDSNWQWIMKNSGEMARRPQNWMEMLGLEQPDVDMIKTSPRRMWDAVERASRRVNAAPMASMDMMTSAATFLGAYRRSINEGLSHEEAVFVGDRAIRRSHGSSTITNLPKIMRSNGIARLFAAFHGVFSHFLQRNYDIAWKAKDAIHDYTDGNKAAAMKAVPGLLMGVASYALYPMLIEEAVDPIDPNNKMSTGEKWALMATRYTGGLSLYTRYFVNMLQEHGSTDPSTSSSMLNIIQRSGKDVAHPEKYWNKQHAGQYVKDTINAVALMRGLGNEQFGRMSKYMIDLHNKVERTPKYMFYPKLGSKENMLTNFPDHLLPGGKDTWATALTRGTLKERRR